MTDLLERLRAALADRYLIERELGRGGMAIVYLAEDLRHRRQVALKVLRPEIAQSLGGERFLREIQLAARLNHPNILALHDSGESDGVLWYTMPYVEGESLRDRLTRDEQLPIEDALRITKQVADGLEYAHAQGVVHRDIKPENILLANGHAVIADFGIAKAVTEAGGERLTETGIAVGTPAYMSPEQGAGSGKLDGRSDLYSLGCVLYEMLAGEPPYTGPTAPAIVAKKLSEPVPRVSVVRETVPLPVEAALTKALAKAPADRFATVAQFTAALSVDVQAYARRHRRRMWLRRGTLATVALVVIAGGTYGAVRYRAATNWKRVPLDPTVVAMMPFEVNAADPNVATLNEGVPDFLYPVLSGGGGLRAVHFNALMLARADWQERGQWTGAEAPLRLGAHFGARLVLEGRVAQVSDRLTLTAWLRQVPDGAHLAEYTVTGSVDSVPALIMQLAVGLLGDQLGESGEVVASLTGRSTPAVEAYLAGQRAYRQGRWVEAVESYARALALDSTFALAALRLAERGDLQPGVPLLRSLRLLRSTLGAREQAALVYWLAWYGVDTVASSSGYDSARVLPPYVASYPAATLLTAARTWVVAARDDPEALLWYAMTLRTYGGLIGLQDWAQQSRDALMEAWRLDSTTAGLLDLHLSLSLNTGDLDWVRRVGPRYLAMADSTADGWFGNRWVVALLSGDSTTVRELRRRAQTGAVSSIALRESFSRLFFVHSELGLRFDDLDSAVATLRRRVLTPADSAWLRWYSVMTGLTRGRMHQVAETLDAPIFSLMWWLGHPGLDSAAAVAADSLRAIVATNPDAYRAACFVQLYRAGRGDTVGARDAVRRLAPRLAANNMGGGCPAMVEAFVESHDRGRPDSPALDRLEALLRESTAHELPLINAGPVVVARLLRQRGQYDRALAAARSWAYNNYYYQFRTALLKEEGYLAAITGDTASAIDAYEMYLRLKDEPDPGPVQDEVDQVRAALAALVRAKG
jgi:TolB-like protein